MLALCPIFDKCRTESGLKVIVINLHCKVQTF